MLEVWKTRIILEKLHNCYIGFNIGNFNTGGGFTTGVTTYGVSDSIFVGTVGEVENQFSVYTLGDFQLY